MIHMETTKLLVLAAVCVVIAGGAALVVFSNGGDDRPDVPDVPDQSGQYVPDDDASSADWTQWLGGMSVQGVTDSRTPVSASQMKEVWKVVGEAEGAMVWKVPGSPICVGDRTYYHDSIAGKVVCLETSTGKKLMEGDCTTSSMYNTPLAYGDGKIFVPTSTGTDTVMKVLDADGLEQLFVSAPVPGGQVQGPISYHDGKVLFGTYSGEFACFSTEDTDVGSGNEAVDPLWTLDGVGWYNCIPAFFGDDCVIVDKGFSKDTGAVIRESDTDKPGAIAYLVDSDTGAVRDSVKLDMEFSLCGAAAYKDRVYIALTPNNGNYVTEGFKPTQEVRVHSFVVSGGEILDSTEKVWVSPVKGGGTQSIPVFFNDRMYMGGGGATMGSNQPLSVVDIADDGTMTTAYVTDKVLTKGSVVISTGYASPENGNKVYMYVIEYGHVNAGEAADSESGYADIFCLSDSEGQTSAKIEFQLRPSNPQFAFQSFAVSPEGYLLVKNDLCLFCYGDPGTAYTKEDVAAQMDLAVAGSADGCSQTVVLEDVLYRYGALSDSDRKAIQSSYDAITGSVCKVVFRTDSGDVTIDVLRNGFVSPPSADDRSGEMFSGWTLGGKPVDVYSVSVTGDMVFEAAYIPAVTVTFDAAGGSGDRSIASEKGAPMGYTADPVRDGWFFDGWYSGGKECRPQFSVADGDMTLTAHWLKVSTISFDSDGGSPVAQKDVVRTHAVGVLEVPFKAGYEFLGWFHGDIMYTAETVYPLEEGLVLKAHWAENPERTLEVCKGVRVTGSLPEGTTATIGEKPNVGTASVNALRKAVGPSGELFMLGLYGGGIDGTQVFEIGFDVGNGFDGRTFDVFYYISNDSGEDPLHKTFGKVVSGVLTVDLEGKTSSKGVQIEFALDGALGIADMIDKEA